MTDQGMLPKIGKLYKVTSRIFTSLHPGCIVMPFRINSTTFSDVPSHPFVVADTADIDVLAVKIDETGTSHPFIFKFRTYNKKYKGVDFDWRDFLTEVEDDKVELEE